MAEICMYHSISRNNMTHLTIFMQMSTAIKLPIHDMKERYTISYRRCCQ